MTPKEVHKVMGKLVFNLITLTVLGHKWLWTAKVSKSLGGFISIWTELLQYVFSSSVLLVYTAGRSLSDLST